MQEQSSGASSHTLQSPATQVGTPWRLDAASIASRRASKAATPVRRHTLHDVINTYMAGYTGRDPGRASALRMWQATLGERFLDEVSADDVAEVLEALAEQPVMRYAGKDPATGQALYRAHGQRAPATVNRAKVVLGSIFKYAKDQKLISRGHVSPTKAIPGLAVNNVQDRSLSDDQVGALLAYARTANWSRMYLFALMALTTGARRGELLQLRGADLDLDAETPTATARLTKNNEVKVMPLTPAVVSEIRRLGVPLPQVYLFPSLRRDNQPFEVAKSFRFLLDRAGLKGARLHDLRHTVGSTLAREGRSDSEIASVLGHKTLQVVKRYAHVNVKAKTGIVQGSSLGALR
jgi:integrase